VRRAPRSRDPATTAAKPPTVTRLPLTCGIIRCQHDAPPKRQLMHENHARRPYWVTTFAESVSDVGAVVA
jgi:hypothetical protein